MILFLWIKGEILRIFSYNRDMINFIKKNKWFLGLSVVIPLALMGIVLFANGIYWGSSRSILAGDSYHQYVALHALYRNILHSGGHEGFFYTFTSGLGLNLYAFSAYYMGSFFMPLTFFFNVHQMPDALYLLTLLKTGSMGLSFYVAFKNCYQKLSGWVILGLSCAYALMSFVTSQIEIIMWLDVFILLPLVIWGLHRLQDKRKRWLYFVSVTILFIQNYYFGFMVALFLVFYFLARTALGRWSWKVGVDFIVTSLCAGISSLVMLLPMYLDLKSNNSDAFSQVTQLFSAGAKPFDVFAKNFVGSYDTTQYGAVPMIYVGLFPLILAVLFFFIKGLSWRVKVSYLGLILILVASFNIQVLDLFWQGMHSPNMFLHRYAFLWSILILILACEALVRIDQLVLWRVFLVVILLGIGFSAAVIFGNYAYLKLENILLTALFALAYVILGLGYFKKWIPKTLLFVILFVFMAFESGINGFFQVAGVQKEWNFADRSYYNDQTKFLNPLAQKVRQLSASALVRTENTVPDTANDGMKYNYNSVSQFSSVRNSHSSSAMKALGFHTDSTYLNLRYPQNTLLMDGIFAIRYNINSSQPAKYGFKAVSTDKKFSALTENTNAQNIGIFVPGAYHDFSFLSGQDNESLTNQTNFINALTNQIHHFYQQVYPNSEVTEDKITGFSNQVTLSKKPNQTSDVAVTYGITAPANSQFYLSVPNLTYSSTNSKSMMLTVGKVLKTGQLSPLSGYSVSTDDVGHYFDLGYFTQETPIKVTISFPKNSQVSFDTTSFWALDTKKFSSVMTEMKSSPVRVTQEKNGVNFEVTAKSNGDLFVSLPYDKGWAASVDGKVEKIKRAQGGFMKIKLEKGTHQIRMRFVPDGFKLGLAAFFIGIFLFIGYDRLQKKH